MEIRFAVPDDAPACNGFYNDYYGTDRTGAQWRWEFVTPTGAGGLPFVVAWDADEVVGTQAFIPIRFIDKKGIFLTAKSEETLVSPKMRGRQLFPKMYEPLFQYAKERDFKSIWGFTPAEKAFRKVGFDVPGHTKQLFLSSGPSSLSAVANRQSQATTFGRRFVLSVAGLGLSAWALLCSAGAKPRLEVGERMCNLEDAALFEMTFSQQFIESWGGSTIVRDREYMTWRLFQNPHRRANVVAVVKDDLLLGYVAFALGDDSAGYLIDVMAAHPSGRREDERITQWLISEAVQRLKRMGANGVRGWTFNNHPYDALVRRVARRRGFVVINRGSAVVLHTRCSEVTRGPSHDDFSNWYVTRVYTEGVNG
jgi:GNAT superfamily N-acetyltransferase